MIKTLLACGLAMLGGFQNLNNNTEYVDLNGFYSISNNSGSDSVNVPLNNVGDASFYLFKKSDLTYYSGIDNIPSEYSISLVASSSGSNEIGYIGVTDADDNTDRFWYRQLDLNAGFIDYVVYFANLRITKANYNKFNWEYLPDLESSYITNVTYDLSNLNPVGITGRNYSDYPFIPTTSGNTIELINGEIVYYHNKKVTSLKLFFYPNTHGSLYFYDGEKFYLYSDTSVSYFIMAQLSYYENSEVVTKTISTPVMKDRVNSSNEWVGSAYTYNLTNLSDDIYFLGFKTLSNLPSNLGQSFRTYSNGNVSGGTGNIGNVFDLIGQAFNGFGNFFSVSLIPGITLGMLFVAPLLVSVILWLIHIFKKG